MHTAMVDTHVKRPQRLCLACMLECKTVLGACRLMPASKALTCQCTLIFTSSSCTNLSNAQHLHSVAHTVPQQHTSTRACTSTQQHCGIGRATTTVGTGSRVLFTMQPTAGTRVNPLAYLLCQIPLNACLRSWQRLALQSTSIVSRYRPERI